MQLIIEKKDNFATNCEMHSFLLICGVSSENCPLGHQIIIIICTVVPLDV